ncbi:PAS domain-containing sensor histidine kinase [Mucilaginibacter agri]|uniref:histidine kinase n=1 Tax=Mucilaginibacter agri TaxID=2695265 RepID=A0A966DSK1_9SPHI|nr:PAS domain-containing sensor histidine kinase [Mucilaginibacter agri]NCD68332.1 GHKL domain-containing protein [Mucilaginibacter agri]
MINVSDSLLQMVESSQQLYFSYSLASERVIYLNPAFKDFFQAEEATFTIPALLAMVHREDKDYVISRFVACTAGKNVEQIECRIVRGEEMRHINISAYLVSTDDERLLMGYAEDITAAKTQLNIISKHNAKKNSVLSILAHDLAGPIGVIQNLSDLLHREAVQWQSSRANEYIELVNKISKSCIKLIRDFLDHEFLESAGVSLVKKRVNLTEKIKDQTEQYLRNQNKLHKEISFVVNQSEIYIEVDEDKFLQVINNLLSNALKFTRDGGRIVVSVEEREQSVMIKVADDGIGIPERFHETLFEKFSEARRTGLKGEHSTGLGMSIIKTIVEWHHGKIWFESIENQGTTFFIELPKS